MTDYNENGQLKDETDMVKGLKHGLYKKFSTEGKLLTEAQFKDDKLNGTFKFFNDNGIITFEGNCINNKKEGVWKKYNNEGVLEHNITYENNIETDKKVNPDLPPFYFSQQIIDEDNAKKVQMPSAPKDENKEHLKDDSGVKYEFEKNASEFDSIKEILDFLESNDDIKIRVDAHEYWDGYFQLSKDKKTDNIKHHNLYDDAGDTIIAIDESDGKQEVNGDYAEGYDLNKQTYEDEVCIWAEGFTKKEFLINNLNEFVAEDKENESKSIYEFYDFLDIPQDSWEVMEVFEAADERSGAGREEGLDEFSWHAESYVNSAGVDLIFCK